MTRRVDVAAVVAGVRERSPRALARALSLVESGSPDAADLLAALGAPSSDRRAIVVGITGAPGVGKSTTTNALVGELRRRGRRVAVLAVDPSSPFSGGALLGDRIRMGEHSTDPGVFIRSMAARGHLGGLAVAAPQAIRVLERAGYDVILLETVGVGQSEVEIASRADTNLVLLAPGMGDGIQAAKAGILEIADVLGVNKADREGADATVHDVRALIRLAARPVGAWRPPVRKLSAASGEGVPELLDAILEHHARAVADGSLERRRRSRAAAEVEALVLGAVRDAIDDRVTAAAGEVAAGAAEPHTAARMILDDLLGARPGA